MNGLKKIIYNCRKATYLIDKRLAGKITFRETVELRIHLIGCDVCGIYMKQSAKINNMIQSLLKSRAGVGIRLDDEYKQNLQLKIDRLSKN
ncbi:zf-HC2 domain-containing protein [Mucilaginibacter sp.]|uniref:zf-HC2 domain-containing protein n=1 Tax=Mucilaginibacter sp. TaxID=1882438 RepID=UPI0035BBD1F2